MNKIIFPVIFFSSISLSVVSVAEDYSQYSNDDLFGMKEQVRTMDEASKDAYRSERQSRMMSMDQTERQSRLGDMGASGKRNMDNMSQNGSRKRDGSGSGRGKGRGSHSGSGNQYRYGQGSASGGGQRRYGNR